MKGIMVKGLTTLMLVCLLISTFLPTVSAATATSTDYFTFNLNEDGESYSVSSSLSSLAGEVFVPAEYNGLPVTQLSTNALRNKTKITKVWLPESVVEIEDGAFYGCTALISVDLSPDSINIGSGAFDCCNNLVNFTINGSTNGHGNDIINADGLNCGDGYFVRDGVLFSNYNYYTTNDLVNRKLNNNRLVKYPSGRPATTYVIPNDTMVILSDAFSSPQYLETIVVPSSVQNFYIRSFFNTDIVSFNHPINIIMQHDSYPTDMGRSTFRNLYTSSKIIVKESVKQAFEDNYSHNVYNFVENAVTIEAQDIPTTSLSLNHTSLSLEFGETGVIEATQSPLITTDNLIFTSSDDSIVSFDAYGCGRIEAKGIGTAVLTVTSGSVSTTCIVTVTCEHPASHIANTSTETCTQNGYTGDHVCDKCGTILTKGTVIPVLGHKYGEWEVVRRADCLRAGSRQRKCATCEYIQKETIPATGHNYVTVPALPASCTQNGHTSRVYCSSCGRESTQATTILATGHTLGEWEVVRNATCVSTGLRQRVCSSCGHAVSEVIPATNKHTPSDWIVDKPATCSSAGRQHLECSVCKKTITSATMPLTNHIAVNDAAVAATCSTTGKTAGSHCSVCGTVITAQTTIPKKAHTTGSWIVDKVATTTSAGSKHKKCTVCGDIVETEVIKQLVPNSPVLKSISNEPKGVQITWGEVEGADAYRVYRRGAGSTYWTYLGTVTSTVYLDTSAVNNAYWRYTVRATNEAGYSAFDTTGKYIKFVSTPTLKSISNAATGIYINWTKIEGATGYRVYRRGAGSTYWTYLGTTKNLWFVDNAVAGADGEYYRYTVRAVNGSFSGFDTNGLYIKRLSNPALKSAVSTRAGITVKWGAIKGTTGYYVYRKTANSGWVRIAAVGGTNNTTFVDKSAQKGVTYTYTVRACYGYTLSSYNTRGISCKDVY